MGTEAKRQGPTVDQLIDLAEYGPVELQAYYGRLLVACLERLGPIAQDDGSGWSTTYTADNGGWRKRLTPTSDHLVPANLLPHFRPENRGEEFPPGIPFEPID